MIPRIVKCIQYNHIMFQHIAPCTRAHLTLNAHLSHIFGGRPCLEISLLLQLVCETVFKTHSYVLTLCFQHFQFSFVGLFFWAINWRN